MRFLLSTCLTLLLVQRLSFAETNSSTDHEGKQAQVDETTESSGQNAPQDFAIRDKGYADDMAKFFVNKGLAAELAAEIDALKSRKAKPNTDYEKALKDRIGEIRKQMAEDEGKNALDLNEILRKELFKIESELRPLRGNKDNEFTEEQGLEALLKDTEQLLAEYDSKSAFAKEDVLRKLKERLTSSKARLEKMEAKLGGQDKKIASIKEIIRSIEGLMAKAEVPSVTPNKNPVAPYPGNTPATSTQLKLKDDHPSAAATTITDPEIGKLPLPEELRTYYGGAATIEEAVAKINARNPTKPMTNTAFAVGNFIVTPPVDSQPKPAPQTPSITPKPADPPIDIAETTKTNVEKPSPQPSSPPPEAAQAVATKQDPNSDKTLPNSTNTEPVVADTKKPDSTSTADKPVGTTPTPANPGSTASAGGRAAGAGASPSSASLPGTGLSAGILPTGTKENATATSSVGVHDGAGSSSGGLTATDLLFPSMGAIAGGATALGAAMNVLANGNSREKADGARKSLSDLDAKHPGVSENVGQVASDVVFSWRKMKKMAGDAVAKVGDFAARVFGTSTGKSSATGTGLASSSGGGSSYSGSSGGSSEAKKDTFKVADSGIALWGVGEVPRVNPKTDVTFKPLLDATASLVFGNGVTNLAKGINEINDVIEATAKEEALASAKGDAEFSNEDGTLKKGILQELYETEVLTSARALRDWFTPDREPASASASASKDVFRAAAIDAGNALPKSPPGKSKEWYQRFLEYVKVKLGIQDPNAKIAPVSVANK